MDFVRCTVSHYALHSKQDSQEYLKFIHNYGADIISVLLFNKRAMMALVRSPENHILVEGHPWNRPVKLFQNLS